jgi:NADPH2:quinone reductase
MKAIQIHETGGPEVLTLADLPIPEPGPGQVLIRVEATGVNFIEVYFRKGVYKASLPLTPGSEAAGTVEELGPGVTGFVAGDAVASVSVLGSYAEYALVPATQLVKTPDGLSPEQAAAAMLQGMTAHYLSHSTFPLKAGRWFMPEPVAWGCC